MKRILMTCAAVVVGAGIVWAASPQVASAIKAIEAVGNDPGKLKLFCDLNKLLQGAGEKDDPAVEKQTEDIVAQLGDDFSDAWETGETLDESTPDGQEFYGAVDTLSEKCQ